jgi:hypothetical protein
LKTALTACLLAVASGAQALSCLGPDPLASLRVVRDDPAPWVVLQGHLDHSGDWKPDLNGEIVDSPPSYPAWVDGATLGPSGFAAGWSGPVTLQPRCIGPYCGGLPEPGDYLMFARQSDDGLTIMLGPCGGTVFRPADAGLVRQLVACLNGGACG